jgi:UDP-glucose 4-epimerase
MAFEPACNRQIINIGPDDEFVTINEFAATVARLLQFDLNITYTKGRPQEVELANCSADKARRLLGYEPKVKLEEGLEQMIDWISLRGARPFKYHLDLEIVNEKTPDTWSKRLF